ncbi:vegetative incompatibility het-e-1 [Fusarium sporotrichioides]|uniref:Vegetative incompatibility het-e-1 n=1 Tax=Fusarium sporotrichioides TaxID=5514 RepID=A0A395RWV5_FUSSP|nr:vegetative incompatibility het-e-1 [Fusarium sporotrichioides]
MSCEQAFPPLTLSAQFELEVENALAQDPSLSPKVVFFEVWRKLKPQYEAMHQALKQYLSCQLKESSIRATLYSRVKKKDSIFKSIVRREESDPEKYKSANLIREGIHDLLGFRIVVDYPSGLKKSDELIRKRFSVQRMNSFSSDREVGVLWKPRFGAYEGNNYQVRMTADDFNKGLSMYYKVLFEIQVTSIAESLYNKLAHPLHYKQSSGPLCHQDEMIIDISHGLSLCYWITIACMEDRLEESLNTDRQQSPLPDAVRMVAGHDPEDSLNDLDHLVKVTPDMPILPGTRSQESSKAGSSSLKGPAPSRDTVSIESLLKSLIDLPRENRSDTEIWNGIRDKLGLDDETYNRFLKSLTYDRMNERKNSIQNRHRHTFEWVFGNEDFEAEDNSSDDSDITTAPSIKSSDSERTNRKVEVPSLANWLEDDVNSLYWVSGKPGSGKSFFMKFVEKDKRTTALLQKWQPQCRIISHYLWKPGSDDQRSFKGVVCSLLHQMLQNEKPITLHLLHETPAFRYKNDSTDWNIKDLKKLFFNVLSRSADPCFILIDGLDEMSKPHDGMKEVFKFLERLARLERVKVCVSSRPENPFTANFKSQPHLRMQDLTKYDILIYTLDKLKELDLEFDKKKFQKATNEITRRAKGVFIWAYMVLKQIRRGVEEFCETWDDVLEHISELTSDIIGLYRDMLSRLGENDERYIKKAARYFQYIQDKPARVRPTIATLSLVADENVLNSFTRPEHTPREEEWEKICRETEKTLVSISAGLLEAKSDMRETLSQVPGRIRLWERIQVDFIHRTAIDFLEGEQGKTIFAKHSIGPKDMLMLYVKVHLVLVSYTEEYLQSNGTYNIEASAYVLIGACFKARRPSFSDRTIYMEVNDAWFARNLLKGVHVEKDIKNMVKEDAHMRILLTDKRAHPSADKADLYLDTTEFFRLTVNGDTHGISVHSITELDSIEKFLHDDPNGDTKQVSVGSDSEPDSTEEVPYERHISATSLGRFRNVFPVLMEIGEDLPDVNKTHVCLHDCI